MDDINKDKNLLKHYVAQINNFEDTYIKYIFNEKNNYQNYEGYLINLESYQELKRKIYSSYDNSTKSPTQILKSLNKLSDIEIRTSNYLLNMLWNGNEYIIINKDLWNLFVKKEKAPINYTIKSGFISFALDNKFYFVFDCKKCDNIIHKNLLLIEKNKKYDTYLQSNNNKLEKLYYQMYLFHEFENSIITSLNDNSQNKYNCNGCLIDEIFIKTWKEKTYYEKIVKNFPKFNTGIKRIKNYIIFINEVLKENKLINQTKFEIKNYVKNFKNINELKSYLERNTLVIVSFNFLCNIGEEVIDNRCMLSFSIFNKMVRIYINNELLDIKTNNNIITLKPSLEAPTHNSTLKFIHLKQLINIFYFKEEIKARINSIIDDKANVNNEIYLLKKEPMDRYKRILDYNSLSYFIKNSPSLLQVNYNNFKYNFDKIIEFFRESNKSYIEQIEKKISNEEIKFKEDEYNMPIKIYPNNKNSMNYLDEFEIVNQDIIDSFEELGIIKKEKLIKGEYLISDNKMLIIFQINNKKIFQIHFFDNNNENLIIEYLIEDLTNWTESYFKEKGIKFFLHKSDNGQIKYGNTAICNIYKIIGNEQGNNEPKDKNIFEKIKNKEDLIKIFSFLLSYGLFEKKIQSKFNESQAINDPLKPKNIQSSNYYLVNKKIISEFLNQFWDEKINEIISRYNIDSYSKISETIIQNFLKKNEYPEILKSIVDKIDIYMSKIKIMDLLNIETSNLNDNESVLIYPKNFIFLDENLFTKFTNLFSLNITPNMKKDKEIFLTFNCGNIAFYETLSQVLNNKLYLAYIYSIENNSIEKFGNVNFNIKYILSFKYPSELFNNFREIIKKNISLECDNFGEQFENKFNLKIHRNYQSKNGATPTDPISNSNSLNISQINQNKLFNGINICEFYKDNNKEKFWNELLYISFKFCLQYKNFYNSVEKYLKERRNEYAYIINKKYMDKIKSIAHFDELSTIIAQNEKIKNDFSSNDYSNFLIGLKTSLNSDSCLQYYQMKDREIYNKLKFPNLYQMERKYLFEHQKSIFYYENIQIINQKIFECLEYFDKDIKDKCIGIDLFFYINKLIIYSKEIGNEIISIGQINKNEEFKTYYLIQSEDYSHLENDLNAIFQKIKNMGYELFLQYYTNNSQIIVELGTIKIFAKFYKVPQRKDIKEKDCIYKQLKAIILIAISQNNDINKSIENNQDVMERVYLMKYNFLMQYFYDEVVSLINENKEICNNINTIINNPQKPYDSDILDEILPKLNQNNLKKINDKFKNINITDPIWEAKAENLTLKNDKHIKVYKEFILIKKDIFDIIKNMLSLSTNIITQKIYYLYSEYDILSIDDTYKYYLLVGNLNKKSHLFNLSYIMDFNSSIYIDDEIKFIKNNGIENYIKEKTVFIEEDNKDLISPIFSQDNEIGNFYKHSPGTNYSKTRNEDYTKYINSNFLMKAMNLYNHYNNFKLNLESGRYSENYYYLIKKDIMNSIKKDYKYDIILNILKKGKFNPKEKNSKKKILYVLKNMPEDIFEDYIKNKKYIEKCEKEFVGPETISVNYPDSNDYIKIYNNFEIIDKTIALYFIKDLNYDDNFSFSIFSSTSYTNSVEYYIECTLKEGKIIINYPKSKFDNGKYVYSIGTLNKDNTFINEYLIIYERDHANFSYVKNNLNNYLNSLQIQFINGVYPISNNDGIVIGKVIKSENINSFVSSMNTEQDYKEKNNPGNNFNNNQFEQNKFNIWSNNGVKPSYDIDNNLEGYKPKKPLDSISIKEYNLDSQISFSSIKNNFYYPPLIGLDNIGATCYMNATLQCLCNIQKFVDYFKYNKHLNELVREDVNLNNSKLASSFKLLVENLWPDKLSLNYGNNNPFPNQIVDNSFLTKKNKSYAPKEFKEKISSMNSLFKGVAANDAKDLVQFLIMTLHNELNKPNNQIMNNICLNQDQRNPQVMFNIFTQDFVKNNSSLISDLFYAVNCNVNECQGCKIQTYNYQTYFFFVFPLEEVRKFKNQNKFNNNYNMMNFNNNINYNNGEINIYDCFMYEQRINNMGGENSMYCNYCKNTCNNNMCTYITYGPQIMIIILNRGKGIQFKVKINFAEELNLYNFIQYKETGCNYQLIGVITHLGESGMGGHFIAYCKNPISSKWYQYNDSIVKEVNQSNFKTEVIDYAMPYLLFYQKVGA